MIYAIDFVGSLADILAEHLLDKFQANPFDLARVKVILPTRRACQTLKESFFKKSPNKSTLLPQMVALYDMDDLSVDLPPAISDWERLFLLTKLCQAKPNLKETPKAFQVALSLAELLDLSYQYNVRFENLADLVPSANFAQHWQETITFLDIISTQWPKILEEHGVIDKQDRLQRVLTIIAQRIQQQNNYMVMAGLTSDLPGVKALMQAVQKTGDIFLDGVDEIFIKSDTIPEKHHTQYLIYKTIKDLKIHPNQIIFQSQPNPKEELVEQAFRSNIWQSSNLNEDSLKNLKYILSETAEQEALTIALYLRQALEDTDKTACLVTTDRNLARRVISQMKRWQIHLDDSAGIPFKHTSTGAFLLQILALAEDFKNPVQQLALYKNPLFADGQNPTQVRINIKNAEKLARQKHQSLNYVPKEDGYSFFQFFQNDTLVEAKILFQKHILLAETWATTDTQSGSDVLWNTPTGRQLKSALSQIIDQCDLLGKISTREYPTLFSQMIGFQSAHQSYGYHQRIKILGPIEARFTHTDLCIIGGLNEQIFPQLLDAGPWLNRPMREQLHLPDAEAHITNLAHDFMHLASSKEVILSRCIKSNGTPTVASRFIQRLQMVAQVNGLEIPTFRAHLAELVDHPEKEQNIVRPAPCPNAEVRPKKLSVTNVELLKKNPYAIYAKYILSLYPLDDWDNPAKASLYGQAVHDTLSQMNHLLDDQKAFLVMRENLKKTSLSPSDCLFYESIFKSNVWPFFKNQQEKLSQQKHKTFLEITGQVSFKLKDDDFTLTARMDRVDVTPHQSATVIDYKTGTPPSFSKVVSGLAPQLTLEAWILLQGGFKNIQIQKIDDIEYWHMGRHAKRNSFVQSQKEDLNIVIEKTQQGLKKLLITYADAKTPYEVEPVADFTSTYDDYAHLSRKKEWAHADEGENDG